LPEDILAMIGRNELTEGHARAVLSIPDDADRRPLAKRIVAEGMSVVRLSVPHAGRAHARASAGRPRSTLCSPHGSRTRSSASPV
jgi:Predicted transcriptional regulators